MSKPKVFIGSSSEALDYAYGVQENLMESTFPTVWKQGVFKPSQSNLESLVKAMDDFEFGIFIFSPDDISIIRDTRNLSVRDNVIFELGLFIGRLGRDKCFIITPTDDKDIHFPTDILGFNPLKYDEKHPNITASLGVACSKINKSIKEQFEIQKISHELRNIKQSKKIYIQSKKSDDVLESKNGFVKFNLANNWRISPNNNPAAEFQLTFHKGDLYATIITERIEIPIKSLTEFAIQNLSNITDDYEVLNVEVRNVNGKSFVMMDIECTLNEIKFRYRNFYWSGKPGSLQILTYTGINLFEEFKNDIDYLLNGVLVCD